MSLLRGGGGGGGGLMRGIKIPQYEFALKMQGGRICGTLRYMHIKQKNSKIQAFAILQG